MIQAARLVARTVSRTRISVLVLAAAVLASTTAAPSSSLAEGLDVNAIPYVSERTRDRIAAYYDGAEDTSRIMIAVGSTGNWGGLRRWRKGSDDDMRRNALQKCEHYAGEPCVLVVENGKLTMDENGDFPDPEPALSYPSSFKPDEVPFISERAIQDHMWRYYSADRNRAVALTRNGRFSWVTQRSTPERAAEDALKKCQGERKRPCFVYAINGDVVFDIDTDISNRIKPQ
jgi:hypothetical protein